MKQWIITLLCLAGLGYGSFYLWKEWQAKVEAEKRIPRVKTATVEARDIQFAITAAGDIGPAEQVSVRPEINGRIAQLPVDIGDNVKTGELLFRLDDQELQIEKTTRLIEIEGAKLQLQRAERNFVRTEKLFKDELISKELYDDTKTEFELGKNALERADKTLRLIEDRLSKTKILAPFDCTVLTRPVSVGQAVSGASGFNSGTEVLTIANLNEMVINAHINQADVARLKTGQPVDIQVDSVPGLKMKGEVERIAPQATIKNNIKGFASRVVLKEMDPRVRPGMTANLSIPVSSAGNVLSVPLAAVFTERGERYVFVKNGDAFERREILTGVSDYENAEITSGLAEGEIVALEQPGEVQDSKGSGDGPSRAGNSTSGATRLSVTRSNSPAARN